MQFIQTVVKRIWADISRGRNVDVYLILAVAFSIAILKLSQLPVEPWLAPITLAVLGVLAVSALVNRDKLEQLIKGVGEKNLVVYKTWREPDIYKAVSKAKSSVEIIETWVGDAMHVMGALRDATQRTRKVRTVRIYMLDPKSQFAAQRIAEIRNATDSSDLQWKQKYEQAFDESVSMLEQQWSDVRNVDLYIYKYSMLPAIRMLVVDRQDFMFTWFPLGSASTENVCFRLSLDPLDTETSVAITKLIQQLDRMHSVSSEFRVLKTQSKARVNP